MRRPAPLRANRAAEIFHALSDRTRLDIIAKLTRGERCVCELTDALSAAQPRLSFHLKVLKDAGLLRDRRAGRWVYYSLRPESFAEAAQTLQDLEKRARLTVEAADECCA